MDFIVFAQCFRIDRFLIAQKSRRGERGCMKQIAEHKSDFNNTRKNLGQLIEESTGATSSRYNLTAPHRVDLNRIIFLYDKKRSMNNHRNNNNIHNESNRTNYTRTQGIKIYSHHNSTATG
jgi:hypothetical protein